MLVHGEFVGSIRMHLDLPLYRLVHCLALVNGLFATLLLYQRIVNLMAAVEGIGCHHLKKKKKKKKSFFTKAELDHDFYIRLSFSSRVFNLDCSFDPMVHFSCKAKQFLELMVPKEAMSWVGSMAS